MNLPREIKTKALLLRRIELDDARLIFEEYSQDMEVARYMAWKLTGKFEDTLSFVRNAVSWWANPETGEDFVYSVFISQSQQFIGCCSAGPHAGTSKYHWGMGYNFGRRFWGKGYATEAVAALTDAVMQQPGVIRLSAVVDIENPASARVLEKCGFKREGILHKFGLHPNVSEEPRDIFMYAKTK
jgi:ribosomal-protein-alanine N-acetyltransferase